MKLPLSIKNWVSIAGALLAIFNLACILTLFVLNTFLGFGGSYLGLFIYIILPVFMIAGLLLIPIGMRIQKLKLRKLKEKGEVSGWPVIDFNLASTRNAGLIFLLGTAFLLLISSIGSYEAFHYTESVEFCGKLCHKVMEPEYVTYHGSSHERVACVECHVGEGAGWYVKSKLSGLYQVYSVLAHKYPQPIATPIANLRPAQETCEHCHWPQKFYDDKLKVKHSYLTDSSNTEVIYHMLMKTSTKTTAQGVEKGIHQHISPDVKIEYKSTDLTRQVIPWVRYTNRKTGESYVYVDNEAGLGQKQLDSLEIRVMDCLDCHNRPSHNYHSPQNFMDKSIYSGKISTSLPEIKLAAMQVLYKTYSTKDSAMMEIRSQIEAFYKNSHPEILSTKKELLEQAITEIQNGYSNNIFPYMKASWKAYPNHLGHLENNGCYRCHNDRHATESGKVISRNCKLCHDIKAQGLNSNLEYATTSPSLDFKHPVDVGEDWKTELCSSCHNAMY